MPECELVSPLLDGMEQLRCLSNTGGTSLFLLRHRASGGTYLVKRISIPESQTQVEALLLTGGAADEEAAKRYYEQIADDYEDRLAALDSLQGSSHCATYLGHQVCAREEGVGFSLYLLSERYVTLPEYLQANAMTHLKALNLGLDLCSALCELRQRDLIHRDIKPKNIYLNAMGGFMVGDLGVARIAKLKYCPMPDRMISEYTAPEVCDAMGDLNTTVDIYSVGMVLYRILNGNHGPFEDEDTSAKAANRRRISGEELPSPLYADYELAAIVLKACAFGPADRYQSPEDLLQELVLYMKRNEVTDSLIVPPLVAGEDMLVPAESVDEPVEPVRFAELDTLDEDFIDNFSPSEPEGVRGLDEERPDKDGLTFAAPRTRHNDEEDEDAVPLEEERKDPDRSKDRKGAKARPASHSGRAQKRRKPRLWIAVVVAVVLLGAIGVCGWFLLLGGPSIAVPGVTISDRGVDSLTVTVDQGGKDLGLRVACKDAYGNAQYLDYNGEPVTFQGLASGTPYTVTVISRSGRQLTGQTSATASTIAVTQIVDFTASSPAAGQVDLKLTVSGPDPGEWTIRYNAEGGEAREIAFSGGAASIFNLETGKHYTFTLLEPKGVVLEGTSTIEYTTAPEVEVLDLRAEALSGSTARASWRFEGKTPTEWSVTCTGPDGSSKTQFVQDCTADFSQLLSGQTYTITVTAPGVKGPASTTVVPLAAQILGIQAEVQGTDALHVSWTADQPGGRWILRYQAQGAPDSEIADVSGTEATLTGLVPGVSYALELRTSRDEPLGENAKTEAALPAAGQFSDYGAERFFLGTFVLPEKADWTRTDLDPNADEFSPGAGLAFALDSFTGHTDSEDEIRMLTVVEDSDGVPLCVKSETKTWNDLWDAGVILGSVDTLPSKPGSYTLRVYLNGRSAAAREITILDQ